MPATSRIHDDALLVLALIRHAFPWLRPIFIDAAYAGDTLRQDLTRLGDWGDPNRQTLRHCQGISASATALSVRRMIALPNRNR
jgi:hypothetical protein